MTAFSGSALYAHWVTAAGTIVLTGDQRTMNISHSLEFIDTTAGADEYHGRLPSYKDAQVTWSSVLQSGAGSLISAVATGTPGTLSIGVEGSATGKPKITLPAYSMGPSYTIPYNDIVDFSCTFQGNGAETNGTW